MKHRDYNLQLRGDRGFGGATRDGDEPRLGMEKVALAGQKERSPGASRERWQCGWRVRLVSSVIGWSRGGCRSALSPISQYALPHLVLGEH